MTENESIGHGTHFWGKFEYNSGLGSFVLALGESGHIEGPKNGTSSTGTKNPRSHLQSKLSSKMSTITFDFKFHPCSNIDKSNCVCKIQQEQ